MGGLLFLFPSFFSYDINCAHAKVIGGWPDVLTMCEKGHLQPQVLFFEAVD